MLVAASIVQMAVPANSSGRRGVFLESSFINHSTRRRPVLAWRPPQGPCQREAEMALAELGRRALSHIGKAPSRSGAPRLKSKPLAT